MRTRYSLFLLSLPFLCLIACQEDEIKTYAPEDSAVVFHAPTSGFSFKGMTEAYRDLNVAVELVGYCADYDREFRVEADDSTAVLGRDFTVLSSTIEAGAVSGFVRLRVNHLPDGVETQATRLRIVPNEYFREGPPSDVEAVITWSEEYTRPNPYVWQAWYLFFCQGYSKELHRLLITYFGESIEHSVYRQAPARDDPTLEYHIVNWWYTASREFRAYVRQHDETPGNEPFRHSEDYMLYKNYSQAEGAGTRPETIPTILETLNVM